jgi:hypothetical protein
MFTVTIEGIDELLSTAAKAELDLNTDAAQAVTKAASDGATEGVRTATWKDQTGNARKTITSRLVSITPGNTEAEMVAPLFYHRFLDEGTKPHEILPVKAKFLRFIARDGALVFAKRVMHPGTKGDGFAGRMYLKAERVLWAQLEVAAEKFAKRFE